MSNAVVTTETKPTPPPVGTLTVKVDGTVGEETNRIKPDAELESATSLKH